MKTFIKANHILPIFCFIFMFCGSKSNKSDLTNNSWESITDIKSDYKQNINSCDFETAGIIGLLYVWSCPSLSRDESDFESLVNKIYPLLDEDGDVIRCMRRLGELLVNQGYQNFNFNEEAENRVHERTMDMAMKHGNVAEAKNIADNVVSSMRNEQLQPIIIGQELIWLSKVLPDAANDDWYDYYNTCSFFRQQAIDQIEQIKIILRTMSYYGGLSSDDLQLLGIVLPAMEEWSNRYGAGYIVATGIQLGVFK
ncbi:MAG TPA: hypothetical protein VJ939_08210 [Bacteroidales bacterium]|nr:hypothetical protein [Bacteroidales bacterium]